ncbi:MAG: M23 family metallopeptidase, partial [Ignavibacteriaceae bacterium]|nr:M23 family metallopeptidase [Ignavibacteriaceae bacterium]
MPLFKYLKNLKSFSVVIVPDDASHDARSKKFTPVRILFIAIIYTVFITVFGYYFLILTGIGNKFLPGKYVQTAEEVENIKELNQKMIFLAKELQILKSTNLRLKYALVLGDSTLADTLNVPEDSLKKFYKNPKEGNLLGVIFEYINYLFHQDDNSIFFILPVNGYISRGFDPDRGHFGIDIVAKVGTPVFASAGGFVVFSSYTNDYGHVLILSHSDGYLSFYKHCSVLLKRDRE